MYYYMENKLREIEEFGMEIIPEYLKVLKEIQTKNKTLSKIRTFRTLFEHGEKKYSPNNLVNNKEFGESFTYLLNKTYMEYSCYLAYGAGCVKGRYGNDYSGKALLELIKPIAKVGKEYFLV